MTYEEIEEARQSRRLDSDLGYMLDDIGEGSSYENLGFGLATIYGANDESSWHWLLWCKDGTYAYATGSCDYTGWGCQSGGSIDYFLTLKEAINAAPEVDDYGDRKVQAILKGQLSGEIPYGCES